MTKYILQSGGIRSHPGLKKKFHNEIVHGSDATPKILLCHFAQPEDLWDELFDQWTDLIIEDVGCNPHFMKGVPQRFAEHAAWADVVYFTGGRIAPLLRWMDATDLSEVLKGKVVATSSASSCLLSTAFWSGSRRTCADGLGMLPIKLIPHYKSSFWDEDSNGVVDWGQVRTDLGVYGGTELPMFALKEGEYAIFEDTQHIKTITQEDVS